MIYGLNWNWYVSPSPYSYNFGGPNGYGSPGPFSQPDAFGFSPYFSGGFCLEDGWRDFLEQRREEQQRQTEIRGNRIDLNGDGRYHAGIDAELAFDWDGDGSISAEDIKKTKQALGRYDDLWADSDSDSDSDEVAPDLSKFDLDGDGKLSAEELKKAGAQLWIDKNGDGKRGRGEFFCPSDFDSRYRKNQQLELCLRTGRVSLSKSED